MAGRYRAVASGDGAHQRQPANYARGVLPRFRPGLAHALHDEASARADSAPVTGSRRSVGISLASGGFGDAGEARLFQFPD